MIIFSLPCIFSFIFGYCNDLSDFFSAEEAIINQRGYAYMIREINEFEIDFENTEFPDWMVENIRREVREFSSSSLEELEHHFLKSNENFLHFRIRNGVLYFRYKGTRPSEAVTYSAVLHKILSQKKDEIQTADFLINLSDGVGPKKYPCPTLCFSKYNTSNAISIPDRFAITQKREELVESIEKACSQSTWDTKIPQGFWIGPPNGGGFHDQNLWRTNCRSRLVLFSLDHPDLVWARFTRLEHQDHVCNDMKQLDGIISHTRIPEVDSIKYKYLIDVDGYASSYYRPQWILRSNCVLIKEDSGNEQWYFSGLKPYIHYVPYTTDCSNLKDILLWLQENDDKARAIALEGRKFSFQYLNRNVTYMYLFHVMKECANLEMNMK